jgi:D-serine deaminase-like pyridoxal phosphate-dependent protein
LSFRKIPPSWRDFLFLGMSQDYQYYNSLFKNLQLPLAWCDLDLLAKNCAAIAARLHANTAATPKSIRIASKSIRCTFVLDYILKSSPVYKGLMCFSGREALFLSDQGFDDLLLGYPIVNREEIFDVCVGTRNGKKIYLMVDCEQHLQLIDSIAREVGIVQPLCIDIDMSTDFPGIHFGVMRSPLTSVRKAKELIDTFGRYRHIRLAGVMGYEAQVAGLGEKNPANGIKNYLIPLLKKKSILDYSQRRREIVEYISSKGCRLDFVNAGGTGSIESSNEESWVTEITAGSGFFSPALFDYYHSFRHLPSAGFAVQIVRKPKPGYYTCLGGGYIASGTVGADKQPKPYLPEGVKLTANEGTGEVQTPVEYKDSENLDIGDTVLFRHSKAGELCERFNELHIVSAGTIVDKVPTYRGQGQCFL